MNNNLPSVKIDFTPEQIQLLKNQIAPKATNDELKLFIAQCERTQLDPFARQIYCIHMGNKMSIQVSIDGFRVIAERSDNYAGQDEPVFTYDDNKLASCKVNVYKWRGNQRYVASVGVAMFSEYTQGNQMWNKMPHAMLAKCAEAIALRRAFPQDLSGLYTKDEMEEDDVKENLRHEPDMKVGDPIEVIKQAKPSSKSKAIESAREQIRNIDEAVLVAIDQINVCETETSLNETIKRYSNKPEIILDVRVLEAGKAKRLSLQTVSV
ncbi:MAG: phage recombination protein Bet [bacterium]|nr:phage recombination protein Bet [bacterium]